MSLAHGLSKSHVLVKVLNFINTVSVIDDCFCFLGKSEASHRVTKLFSLHQYENQDSSFQWDSPIALRVAIRLTSCFYQCSLIGLGWNENALGRIIQAMVYPSAECSSNTLEKLKA